jgi:hypothetical protein
MSGLLKGVPQPLFPTQLAFGINRLYAVDRNGERFLLPIALDPRVIAVTDWGALLAPYIEERFDSYAAHQL